MQGLETATNNNLFISWKVLVVNEDATAVLATIVPLTRTSASEFGTSLNNRAFSATSVAYTATENCRIVVEMGAGGTPSGTSGARNHDFSLRRGENGSGGDLLSGSTTSTTLNPWIEFANTIVPIPVTGTLAATEDGDTADMAAHMVALTRTNLGYWAGAADNDTTATFTTPSFTPADNSLLVIVFGMCDEQSLNSTGTMDITDSLSPHLDWTKRFDVYETNAAPPDNGQQRCAVFTAPVTTGQSMTVTCGTRPIGSGQQYGYQVHAVAYTDYNIEFPIGASVTVAATPTWTFPAGQPFDVDLDSAPAATSEIVAINCQATGSNNLYIQPGTGWTELYHYYAGYSQELDTQVKNNTTSPTVHWNYVCAYGWGVIIAFEVKATAPETLVHLHTTGTRMADDPGTNNPHSYTGLTVPEGVPNPAATFEVNSDGEITSATWAGAAMDRLAGPTRSGDNIEIWGIANPAPGNGPALFYGSSSGRLSCVGTLWRNVDQTGGTTSFPNGASTDGSDTGTIASTPSINRPTSDIIIGLYSLTQTYASESDKSIWNSSGQNIAANWKYGTGAPTTLTCTQSPSGYWATAAVAVKFASLGPPAEPTGSLAAIEQGDTANFAGLVGRSGSLSARDAADTSMAAGSVAWAAALAAQDANDTSNLAGLVGRSGTMAATEADDTSVAAGSVAWAAALSVSEGADTAMVAGSVAWIAPLAATEGADTATVAGLVGLIGSAAATDAADSAALAASVFIPLTGTLAAIDAADTANIAGRTDPVGTLVGTEAGDAASAAGAVAWAAPLAAIEAADTADLEVNVPGAPDLGTLAATDATDTANLVLRTDPVGTMAARDAADTAALPGQVRWLGTMAAQDVADTANLAGLVGRSGSMAARDAADTSTMAGGVLVSGTLAARDAADAAIFSEGYVNYGALSARDAVDAAAGSATVAWAAVLATVEAGDVAHATGLLAVLAALSSREVADTALLVATTGWSAALAATEAGDHLAVAGSVAWTATLDTRDGTDVAHLTALASAAGSFAVTELHDLASFAGLRFWTGGLEAHELPDRASFSALAGALGPMVAREAADGAAVVVRTELYEILAAIEAGDIAVGAGKVIDSEHHLKVTGQIPAMVFAGRLITSTAFQGRSQARPQFKGTLQ